MGKARFILIRDLSVQPQKITYIPVTCHSEGNLPLYKQTLTIMQNASPPGILWATGQVSQGQCCVGSVSQLGGQWSSSLCVLNMFSSYWKGQEDLGREFFWVFGHSCYTRQNSQIEKKTHGGNHCGCILYISQNLVKLHLSWWANQNPPLKYDLPFFLQYYFNINWNV